MKKVLFLLIILAMITNVFSTSYYADIEINIENTGIITINGETNLYELQNITNSNLFTSKNKQYWLLNLTTENIIDDYIYKINLPENSVINYINIDKNFRIEQNDNKISLIGLGSNKKLNILIQYEIKEKTNKKNYIILLTIILTLILIVFLFIKYKKKIKRTLKITNTNIDTNKIVNLEKYPIRQQDIIKIIIEKKHISQKEIEEIMQIPKSSISRNIKTLISKNILEKEKIGNSVYLKIKENK